MEINENIRETLEAQYLQPGETPEDMLWRVAKFVAGAERLYGKDEDFIEDLETKYFKTMNDGLWLPSSPFLMNAGTSVPMLGACFVLSIEDNTPSIFETLKRAAIVHKMGGGTGFEFSPLRAKGAPIKSTGGTSTGVLSFLSLFDAEGDVIKQGGRRRSANLAGLRVDHPEILAFIDAKLDLTSFTNFNISVIIPDWFMQKVEANENYNLIDHLGNTVGQLNARNVFLRIIKNNWEKAEPGVLFLDNMNKGNMIPHLGEIRVTNPCVTGDSLVSTEKGYIAIEDLVNIPTKVYSEDGNFYPITGSFVTGTKEVFELTTRRGYRVKATGDHKFRLSTGDWTELKDLSPGDSIYVLQDRVDNLDLVDLISPVGHKVVYDLTEPINHCFYANGILVHNCGEQPLLAEEACNLASINLEKFVANGQVTYDKLRNIVYLVMRFLDSSIDVNMFPLPEVKRAVLKTRKTGLGIMGLHGLLIKLGLTYNSNEGRQKAQEIMAFISKMAITYSEALAAERGVPEGWFGSSWQDKDISVRNLVHTCIAPTGTIGLIANTSSYGCEPIFKVVYARVTRGIDYKWVNPLFEAIGKEEGWYNDDVIRGIINNDGKVTGVESVPKKWRDLFITAEEISPRDHILMQAALQEVVDGAISKTINMPSESDPKDIYEAYTLAWASGCKGATIYREGSREGVMTTIKTGEPNQDPIVETTPLTRLDPSLKKSYSDPKKERPEFLLGVTSKIQSGCGKIWVTINPFKGGIREVFCTTGSEGGCSSNIEEIARQISLNLWWGVPLEEVLDQLESTKCARAIANPNSEAKSCSHAIAKRIRAFLELYDPDEWDHLLQAVTHPNGVALTYEPRPQIDDQTNSFVETLTSLGCKGGNCG